MRAIRPRFPKKEDDEGPGYAHYEGLSGLELSVLTSALV